MELDEFKDIWKKQETASLRNAAALDEIVRQRSKKPLGRIYRNMVLEVVFSALTFVVVVIFILGGINYLAAALILALFGLISWVYFYVYRQTRVDFSTDSFKTTVLKLNRMFSFYQQYINLCLYGLPVGFLLGYTYSWMADPEKTFGWQILGGYALVIPVTALSWFPIKWIIRKYYGKHIVELKALVAELKDD
jgi:hypothetical protein